MDPVVVGAGAALFAAVLLAGGCYAGWWARGKVEAALLEAVKQRLLLAHDDLGEANAKAEAEEGARRKAEEDAAAIVETAVGLGDRSTRSLARGLLSRADREDGPGSDAAPARATPANGG